MWDVVVTVGAGKRVGRVIGCSLVMILSLMIATPSHSGSAEELLEQPAPDFALKSMSGVNLRLSEYRGEVVLVNFWATWCGACRDQLKALDELHAQYRDTGLNVLGVSVDRPSKRSTKLLADLRPEYPVLLDADKDVSRLYDLDDMPFTVLIDQTGTVRAVFEGFDDDDMQLYQAKVAALMAE